ncbi:NAD(P)-binding protein [Periconia macrospinosa]|uniref:NAD(P)-binding protein n=1 Tax=Periconia macrospinosa TaxID=97972 RepID=A0A2V1DI10_9PLEO|nr:NAD(P)-binding protein [Periconia macrospinosa]
MSCTNMSTRTVVPSHNDDSDGFSTISPMLVLGGCGFLGSHIVDALIAENLMVFAASRKPHRHLNPTARYITLDIHDKDATVKNINVIKPCAIIHTISASPMASRATHRNDYNATKNLLEICHNAPFVKVFVYTSSAEAIANSNGLHKIKESQAILHTHSTAPNSYAEYKALAEALTLTYNQPGICPFSQLCWTLAYSITATSRHIRTSRWIQFGPNKSMNEWVYVENAARAHTLATKALLQDEASGVAGESFFVSDGEAIKFWDFARKLWAAAGDQSSSRAGNRIILPWAPVVALATVIEVLTLIFTFGSVNPPMSRHHLQYMRFGARWDIGKARERLQYEPLVHS